MMLREKGFNPLEIGSYCNNQAPSRGQDNYNGFNPLEIGSYCNEKGNTFNDSIRPVSIPLKSGHIVMNLAK